MAKQEIPSADEYTKTPNQRLSDFCWTAWDVSR